MARSRHLLVSLGIVSSVFLTGGTVAYYEEALPTTLNPLFAQSMVDQRTQELVFDRLYFRSAITSTIKSRLVESEERIEGGKKLKMTVKKGVKWHDGQPFVPEDICFTVDVLMDTNTPSLIGKQYREVLEGCTADKTSATVEFKRAYHNPEERLGFRVIPKHKFESTTILPDDVFGSRPVGTGPMKGTRGRTEARFEAFSNGHHAPKIPLLMLGEGGDPIVQVKTIMSGGVQGLIAVAPPRRPEVRASDDVGLKSYDLRSWWYIAVNQKQPQLKDPKVRQALDLTIDRQQLRELTMGIKPDDPLPACQFISGPFIPSSPYYNRSVETHETADLARAKSLMESAGAQLEHGLWLKGGKPFNLKIGMNAPLDLEAKDLLNQLGNQLQAGGFQRQVHKISNDEWTNKVITGQMADWDLLIGKWSFGVVEDVNPLFQTRAGGKGALNIFNYSSAEVDALLDKYDQSNTDTEAQDSYHELHEVLAEELPYIFLWKLDTKSAWRNSVRGNTITPYYYFTEFDSWSFSG
ncbi:MAG: ABC transporter substrate-binding protein [Alphaproteobacteria bacterium]|nr:ABC transporter substrate-binding protein [Alphaproteobacteria bacterium]